MLVLSRNPGQAIRIGDHIVVRVLEVLDNRVKLAFEAPAEVEIWRDEIWRDEIPSDEEPAPAA